MTTESQQGRALFEAQIEQSLLKYFPEQSREKVGIRTTRGLCVATLICSIYFRYLNENFDHLDQVHDWWPGLRVQILSAVIGEYGMGNDYSEMTEEITMLLSDDLAWKLRLLP
jgi:hypothetical protein